MRFFILFFLTFRLLRRYLSNHLGLRVVKAIFILESILFSCQAIGLFVICAQIEKLRQQITTKRAKSKLIPRKEICQMS